MVTLPNCHSLVVCFHDAAVDVFILFGVPRLMHASNYVCVCVCDLTGRHSGDAGRHSQWDGPVSLWPQTRQRSSGRRYDTVCLACAVTQWGSVRCHQKIFLSRTEQKRAAAFPQLQFTSLCLNSFINNQYCVWNCSDPYLMLAGSKKTNVIFVWACRKLQLHCWVVSHIVFTM